MPQDPDFSISSKEVEKNDEREALQFLKTTGIDAKKLPRSNIQTPDYYWRDVGIEITALHEYIQPQIPDLDNKAVSIQKPRQ
jgi:hypothetical protein